MLQAFGVIVVIIMSNYYLSIPAAVIFTTLWVLRSVYVKTSRDVKRLESVGKIGTVIELNLKRIYLY